MVQECLPVKKNWS